METDPPECVSCWWACQMSSCSGLMPALVVHVERPPDWQQDCPGCGTRGWVKQPPVVRLTDFAGVRASGGGGLAHASPSCPNRVCARGSWTTSDARIAAPRGSVTHRARRWLTTQVGEYRRAVSVVAAETTADQRFGPASPSHEGRSGGGEALGGPDVMVMACTLGLMSDFSHQMGAAAEPRVRPVAPM